MMLNLLHPHPTDAPALITRRIDAGSVLVQEVDELTWLGVRTAAPFTTPCQTDAAIFTVTAEECSLVQATYFGCAAGATSDRPFFSAEHAVDIAFDWARGQGAVTAPLPTLLTFDQLTATAVAVDGVVRALRRHPDGTVTFSVPPGRHTIAFQGYVPAPATATVAAALRATWTQATSAKTVAQASAAAVTSPMTPPRWQQSGATYTAVAPVGDHAVVAGTSAGMVQLIDEGGAIQWQQQVPGVVTQVTSADFGGGSTVIAVGTEDATVHLFSLAGEPRWSYQIPYYKRTGIVRTLVAADLNGDGRDELVVGAENWHHYVLDQQGQKLWHFESVHASTATAVADIDADGRPELIAATEYNWWFAVSNTGEKRWQHNTVQGMGVTHVATARQDDGTHLVAFGCRDGTVQVVDAAGKLRFVLRTADTVTGLAAADVDGDGAEELLVASVMQNTYAVNGAGEMLWRYSNATPPTHLQLAQTGAQPTLIVAETDGSVIRLDRAGAATAVLQMGEAATALTLLPVGAPQLCIAALPTQGLVAWSLT